MSRFQLIIRRENTDLESKLSFAMPKSGYFFRSALWGKGNLRKMQSKIFEKSAPSPAGGAKQSDSPRIKAGDQAFMRDKALRGL